jgi:hypothetical protein
VTTTTTHLDRLLAEGAALLATKALAEERAAAEFGR